MTKTKLTRPEACAELAKMLGWSVTEKNDLYYIASPDGQYYHERFSSEIEAYRRRGPRFFTDRNAAAELVEWIDSNNSPSGAWDSFLDNLLKAVDYATGRNVKMALFYGLLATPEQITLACCAALGIEVE